MTQVGEPVGVGVIDENEVDCPFDHETLTPPTVENKLVGVGTTLASRMKSGSSTHLYKPLREEKAAVLNPRNVNAHPFCLKNGKKPNVVEIEDINTATGEVFSHQYPVTCAAHHLVPAQESLKGSPLLAYMVKKGDSEQLKDETYSSGVVWSDVGYDINGVENGVYLPGSYAVGGGRGGMGVWTDNDDHPDLEDEDVIDVPDPASNLLTGELNEIADDNRKWQYVSQAVALTPGQFHDRHEHYSDFIARILEKIFKDYKEQQRQQLTEQQCPKCKKRADDFKELGVPTPFGLVARLNTVSARVSGHLNGSKWTLNIYTSKWGKELMESKRQRKKRKR